ncbi:MAG: 50S ribosomal protein L30 [candidate division WOR-3 bacterium]
MSNKLLKVKQIKSSIDVNKKHKLILEALGLGRIGKERIHRDTPQIRGMIDKVKYLIEVEEIEEEKR